MNKERVAVCGACFVGVAVFAVVLVLPAEFAGQVVLGLRQFNNAFGLAIFGYLGLARYWRRKP